MGCRWCGGTDKTKPAGASPSCLCRFIQGICHAVSVLRKGGYITMDSDYFLHLTGLGRGVAEKIYERHKFLTEMLVRVGISKEVAEQDACRIELCISDESFEKLKGTLE